MAELQAKEKYLIVRLATNTGTKKIRFKFNPKPKADGITTGYIAASMPIGGNVIAQGTGFSGGAQKESSGHEETQIKIATGIKVPPIETEVERLKTKDLEAVTKELLELRNISITYPLIPQNPKEGERIFAYAYIHYDQSTNQVVYDVVEPPLDARMKMLVHEIKEYIQEKVDINFSHVRKRDAINYIAAVFEKALDYFHSRFDDEKREILRYYIFRDFVGLEKIEPILNDNRIEDISCDGVNINIYVYHRDPRLGSLRTNVVFTNGDELDSFVNKIAERCGRTISISKPLLDGTLPDGSRVQATLGSDIARRGSNYTIRMFTDKPLTPLDIVKFGTCDIRMMAYYWMLIEHGSSFLISGGTATGKTSLLNVLSLFIKPQMKIISIEDTAELRLPHSHWVPEVARTPIAEEGKVDMFELLRESLRQRPDYIIVGEVRGKEAYVLFQQMAVGHPGLSTIHAENFPKLVDRLTSPPISLPPNLMQNLDVIIFLKRIKQGKKYLRRVNSSVEVIGFNDKLNAPIVDEVFSWDPKMDVYKNTNKSVLLRKIAEASGLDDYAVQEELKKRAKVLEWTVLNNITDYRKIASVINLFYTSPDYLLGRIEAI
ncbi:MAG: type II/IV secretion system ATPase subunit [Candidatus Aenigmarchaeota archaeon]|nr:type II/IV secretion system ATPase subunit [Candidatus Aenigmarchaeota archaeon]